VFGRTEVVVVAVAVAVVNKVSREYLSRVFELPAAERARNKLDLATKTSRVI
jgi:hypothetical protein